MDSPALALSHGGGLDRTGDSVGAVGHGDVAGLWRGQSVAFSMGEFTYGGDAVGLAAVDDGSGLGAVGGVGSDNLSGHAGGNGASGTGNESSDRETHIDEVGCGEWIEIERG